MILNLTPKPFYKFSVSQKLATHGLIVMHKPCPCYEEFEELYEKYKSAILKVIVDTSENADIVFNNDVCNTVTCPVVTLDVETVVTPEEVYVDFVEYDPDEL